MPPIRHLLGIGCPSTVSRLVRTVVVDAIETEVVGISMCDGPFPKCCEGLSPFGAHIDAPALIIAFHPGYRSGMMPGPYHHSTPDMIQAVLHTAGCCSVTLDFLSRLAVLSEAAASARRFSTPTKLSRVHHKDVSAIATADPGCTRLAVGPEFFRSGGFQCDQRAETLPCQIQ